MKILEMAFTGYPITNVKRARDFYEGTLGLSPSRNFGDDQQAFIEYDIGSSTLAISNMAPDWKPSAGGGCAALEVDDFAAAVERLKERKVALLNGPFETPVCHMVIISDPDGNSLTIHKRKAGNG